jgi:GT2 family glycosyltransferase
MVDVSIIIVTRNTRAITIAAVQSIFESQDELEKEIIVVDNGSTDGTESALMAEFPTIKFIRSESNLGFARANNLGAEKAAGEFLLLLNSDARLKSDSLRLAVDWMRQNPKAGVAGAQLLNPDGSRQNSIANFPSLATELLNKSLLRRIFPRRFPGKEHEFLEPVQVESVIGAFMLIRRELWQKIGGLDERYFFFFEETDFCAQARKLGWAVFHLPQVQVWHEQGKSAGQWPAAARIEYWRSRYLYFAKHHRLLSRIVLRVGLLVRLVIDTLVSGLSVLLTFGAAARPRSRWQTHSALWRWHLRGCPAEIGLPR